MSNIKKLFYHVSPFHKISESLQSQPGKKKKKHLRNHTRLPEKGTGRANMAAFQAHSKLGLDWYVSF